jgi:hypothetical protein
MDSAKVLDLIEIGDQDVAGAPNGSASIRKAIQALFFPEAYYAPVGVLGDLMQWSWLLIE